MELLKLVHRFLSFCNWLNRDSFKYIYTCCFREFLYIIFNLGGGREGERKMKGEKERKQDYWKEPCNTRWLMMVNIEENIVIVESLRKQEWKHCVMNVHEFPWPLPPIVSHLSLLPSSLDFFPSSSILEPIMI